MTEEQFDQKLRLALQHAAHIAVLTGAGISSESGIPTFREAQTGLWAQYDPQQLATPQAFENDPGLVWRWYQWRRELVEKAAPNPGHAALARLAERVERLTLITQNVDNLHQEAGSENVIELHGNILRTKCYENRHPVTAAEQLPPLAPGQPPRCPYCESLLRPDVVWFGEEMPAAALEAAFAAAQKCDLFLVVGTSALVHPAAQLPLAALQAGAMLVEINPQSTPLSHFAHAILRGPSGTLLPRLIEATWPG